MPEVKSDYDAIKNPSPDVDVELGIDYSLTELGFIFITACKRPSERVSSAIIALRLIRAVAARSKLRLSTERLILSRVRAGEQSLQTHTHAWGTACAQIARYSATGPDNQISILNASPKQRFAAVEECSDL